MYDRVMTAGQVVFVALALLMAAGCHDDNNQVHGCAGAAVLITVMPSAATDGGADADAASPGDGGGTDAKLSCMGKCDDYLEALRVAIEATASIPISRRLRQKTESGQRCSAA